MKTRFYFLLNGFTAFIAFFLAQITHLIIDLYKIDGNSTPAPILNRKTNVFKLQPKYIIQRCLLFFLLQLSELNSVYM